MASSHAKIVLSSSRDIPFNKLVLSQANVRRVKAGLSIEELAESIARRGLIQSLHVRPVLDGEGADTGMFEVPAGGRRYRALELLVKGKRLGKTAPVPCVVGAAGSDILVDEISLAENMDRAPLHPLDQFRAFATMRDKGMVEEEIAAAFLVAVNVVKQRLRLASVSAKLLDVYAEDGMTLDQLMAFSVSCDHARQEQVWEAIKDSWQKEPWRIRRALTETTVPANDKRAVFVGVEAYEAAGGVVLRDLFQSDEGGWLQDAALLDRLTADKLKAHANDVSAEGWKWVETAVSLPYGATQGLRSIHGEPIEMSGEETASRAALQDEYDRLCKSHDGQEDLPDAVDQRLGEIEAAIEELDDRPLRYASGDVAIAGAFVSLDAGGEVVIQRGYVRAEDEPAAIGARDGAEGGDDGKRAAALGSVAVGSADEPKPGPLQGEPEDGPRSLPDRLMLELTAHRTLALRDAVASNPRVAMTALLHKLVSEAFHQRPAGGVLEASVRHVFLPAQADDLRDSVSAKAIAARQFEWDARVPTGEAELWDWIDGLDELGRSALLAHCVSFGLNALCERPNPYGSTGATEQGLKLRLTQADRLARASGLDMIAAGWRPTVENYLGRVPKQRILEAVREGAGERAAQLIDHLKKADMAREAERLLAETAWLPEPLRLADDPAPEAASDEGGDDLPAFLSGDGEDDEEANARGDEDEDEDGASLAAE